jgi:hypothetical protein
MEFISYKAAPQTYLTNEERKPFWDLQLHGNIAFDKTQMCNTVDNAVY